MGKMNLIRVKWFKIRVKWVKIRVKWINMRVKFTFFKVQTKKARKKVHTKLRKLRKSVKIVKFI
mgnify:CR=1 FL=1